jgi:RNase P subunit RPR2
MQPLRVTVTCEECGERMRMERIIFAPEVVHLICHKCEGLLEVDMVDRSKTPQPSAR